MANVRKTLHSLTAPRASRDRFIPHYDRDVFLVSYPRSGNTWMRVAIAEMMFSTSGAGLADIERYVPSIHRPPPASQLVDAPFRVIKSHCQWLWGKEYRKVIYVVRDPRDVALSYYRYSTSLGYFSGNLDDFLSDTLAGRVWPCSWLEHVNSWTLFERPGLPARMMVLRYEDIQSNPVESFSKVAEFLGISASNERLLEIVQLSSADRMREKEKINMHPEETAPGFNFVGRAAHGVWKDSLSPSQVQKIQEVCRHVMARFDYGLIE
jgi:hypothetical protein